MFRVCWACAKFAHHWNNHIRWEIYSVIISVCIGCALERYMWLSNKVFCNIHIGDTLNYLNSRCNTAKLLWVVIYVVCYGCFSPDLVVMNICRQRLIKVDRPLWQRSLANENAVVCRQGAMRWWLSLPVSKWSGQHEGNFSGNWPICS